MNSKDLTFFDKHLEKLILGTGLLVLAIILLLYVVGQPYATTVRGQSLDPVAVEGEIEQIANDLNVQINTYDELPEPEVVEYASRFASRLASESTLSVATIAPWSRPGVVIGTGKPPSPFSIPSPPTPTDVVAHASYSVFNTTARDAILPEQASEVFAMIGNRQPADFAYVSIEGKFDMDEWVDRLEQTDPANPLPKIFWRGKQAIAAVYLQRQELDPFTGEWLEPVIVKTLPTQVAFTPAYQHNYTDTEAREYVEFVKTNQERIARPDFVPVTDYARQWLPPAAIDELTLEDHRELDGLNRKIANLEKRIGTMQDQLDAAANRPQGNNRGVRPQRQQRAPGGGAPGGIDPGGMPGGLGGAPGAGGRAATPVRRPAAGGNNTTREQEMQAEMQRLQGDLLELRRQRDELRGVELDAATGRDALMTMPGMMDPMMMMGPGGMMPGMDPRLMQNPRGNVRPGAATRPGAAIRPGMPGMGSNGEPLEEVSRIIKVWAHDITAQRGKTYRYRLLVSVVHPLFRETRVADEQRSQTFNQLALGPDEAELEQTPWTDPIDIEPEYNFFLIGGTAQTQVATVEVWRYYDGIPRPAEFRVQPGDPIGGETEVDGIQILMNVGSFLVDLVGQTSRTGGLGGTTRMLYVNPNDPGIQSRSMDADRDSAIRVKLKNERDELLNNPILSRQ